MLLWLLVPCLNYNGPISLPFSCLFCTLLIASLAAQKLLNFMSSYLSNFDIISYMIRIFS